MNVLVIEDHRAVAEELSKHLRRISTSGNHTFASSADEARQALGDGPFDLIVCDRSLPKSSHDGGAPSDSHGDALLSEILLRYPGTPVLVLTAFADTRFLAWLMRVNRTGDPFVLRSQEPLVEYHDKTNLKECFASITRKAEAVAALNSIELVVPENRKLRTTDARLIRMFARLRNGSQVRVVPISGGMSGAVTFRLSVHDSLGGRRALAFAKMGQLKLIEDEFSRYSDHLPASLGGAAYASLAVKIDCGAGDVGALFYTLGDGYSQSFFDVIREDPSRAPALVARICSLLEPWHSGASTVEVTVADIRRSLLSDEKAEKLALDVLEPDLWHRVEQRKVLARRCVQHRDLHGENILVAQNGDAIVIDYGDVGEAFAALDLVILEMSCLFHPKGFRTEWGWPSPEQVQLWPDLNACAGGTPAFPLVSACRSATAVLAAGRRDVLACAYAYALRQMKYEDVDRVLAASLVRRSVEELEATYQ